MARAETSTESDTDCMAPAMDTGVPPTQEGRPLRVLMIAPTSFFGDYGCHVRILEEYRTLASMGHRVSIVTYANGRDLDGLRILRTMPIPYRADYEVGSSRHKIAFDALLATSALRAMVTERPDIIHAHLHEGALIGEALALIPRARLGWHRTPVVFDLQGSLTGEMVDHHFLNPKGKLYRVTRWLENRIDHWAPRIITSSSQSQQMLLEQFDCNGERVCCVPDCVNTDAFAPPERDEGWAAFKRSFGIPTTAPTVVYLGLLAEYQGTAHLLRAAQRVIAQRPETHFLIGGYPNIGHYRALARELGIEANCRFPGKIPYEQAPRFMGLGDIAVSPKLSKSEGAGKLLNYMALALPTVSFDTRVAHEYLGPEAVLAPRGDSDAFAERLLWLIDHPVERERIGQALRLRARERFAWRDAGETIVGLYRELLSERGALRRRSSTHKHPSRRTDP